MSHERSSRKIAGAIEKLNLVTTQRKAEAEEKARLEDEARRQRRQAVNARYQAAQERGSTNWRDYVYVSDDDSSGSPSDNGKSDDE